MRVLASLDQRSRRLGILDWKLAQGAAVCIGIMGVKLFPKILEMNMWILVAATALLYVRPLYLFYFESSK